MSAAPYVTETARYGARMGNVTMVDTMVNDALWDAYKQLSHGYDRRKRMRKMGALPARSLDAFSLRSQQRAAEAISAGKFEEEIVPVPVTVKKQTVDFKTDEYPRATSAEALGCLKPAFKKDGGMVTAGNASGINDGAAAIILASEEAVKKIRPKAACTPSLLGDMAVLTPQSWVFAPIYASRQAMERANLKGEGHRSRRGKRGFRRTVYSRLP